MCDGAYLNADGVELWQACRSKEVLIAKIMGSMMSSVSKFVYCVEAIRSRRPANNAWPGAGCLTRKDIISIL